MCASLDANARRIVAFGLRNPFRFAIHPDTNEIYVGNVGRGSYEEIDRFARHPSAALQLRLALLRGPDNRAVLRGLDLNLCESLYAEPGRDATPFFAYDHSRRRVPGRSVPVRGTARRSPASPSTTAAPSPTSYDGALFFADSVRGCIYVMFPGEDGRPDPSTVTPFLSDGGPLSRRRHRGRARRRLSTTSASSATGIRPGGGPPDLLLLRQPAAGGSAHRRPAMGPRAARVEFDAGGSSDADGDHAQLRVGPRRRRELRLPSTTGDCQRDLQRQPEPHRRGPGQRREGASSIARLTVYPGDTPPQPQISSPPPALDMGGGAGRSISRASAEDPQDGELPATSLDWSTRLYHCPTADDCHAHPLRRSRRSTRAASRRPDHDYPSYIELTLTATDSRGLAATETVTNRPRTVELTIDSEPAGAHARGRPARRERPRSP